MNDQYNPEQKDGTAKDASLGQGFDIDVPQNGVAPQGNTRNPSYDHSYVAQPDAPQPPAETVQAPPEQTPQASFGQVEDSHQPPYYPYQQISDSPQVNYSNNTNQQDTYPQDSYQEDAYQQNAYPQDGYQRDAYQQNNYQQNTQGISPQGDPYKNGSSYTWNTDAMQAQPQYYQQPPNVKKKEKKPKGKRTGLKVAAVIMCSVITSAGVLGAFVGMVQNGMIAIEGDPQEENVNPAFTINKIIQDESSGTTIPVGAGVSLLSKQEIAEKVVPSVVCLQIYGDNNYGSMYDSFGFGGNNGAQEEDNTLVEPISQGSGIIYTEDGYVITNAHVVSAASNIKVVTADGTTYEAELVGTDSVTDLAVVKIKAEGTKFVPAEFGSSSDLKVADEVIAIGNPGGIELNSTVTMGYVSALDREVTDSQSGYTMKCIQTDAAINPGNSGGALVNMYGQVIGINSSKIAASGYEGLGFAIPSDTVQPIVTDLMENGYVKDRAMLGISGQFIDSMTGQFYNLDAGMYVAQLNTQEAVDAGLQVYDVITAIDGQKITSSGFITSYLLGKKPGDTAELTISRSSTGIGSSYASKETLTLTLVLTESSAQVIAPVEETNNEVRGGN